VVGAGEEPAGAAQGEAALGAGGGHRDVPAVMHRAEDIVVGDEHVVEEHLGEPLVTVEATEAPDRDARRVEGHQEVGEAAVPLRVGVAAEQTEEVGAEGAPGGPGLLPREAPTAGGVVARGPALDARQVAAGVGFGPALAPQVLGGGHAGQDPVLLLGGAELEHGRGEQEDPVLGDALGATGSVVLLLEDQPLHR